MNDIRRLTDPYDPRLTEFRRVVCLENGAPAYYFDQSLNWRETVSFFKSQPNVNFEEVWKFGNFKWRQTQFDNLECVFDGDRIVQISGCRRYNRGSMLRVNMHFYLLRASRATHRSLNFADGGIWDRHLNYARSLSNCRSIFFTIYPHNAKLAGHARNMAAANTRKGLGGKEWPLKYVNELQPSDRLVYLNRAWQHLFLYKLDPEFQFSGDLEE